MMEASELVGFVASALVLLTFAMKDMRLLRMTGLLSNVAFIIYAGLNGLPPVLLLHVLLLPINGYRLVALSRERAVTRGPAAVDAPSPALPERAVRKRKKG